MENLVTKEYIEESRIDISNRGEEDNHCMILYKTKGQFNERKSVHAIYKNIDVFEKKVNKDIDEIDPDFGISVQLWFFD